MGSLRCTLVGEWPCGWCAWSLEAWTCRWLLRILGSVDDEFDVRVAVLVVLFFVVILLVVVVIAIFCVRGWLLNVVGFY